MKKESSSLSPEQVSRLDAALDQLQPEQSAKDITGILDATAKGQVKNTLKNAVIILSTDSLLRDGIKYNELTQRVDLVRSMGWYRGGTSAALTDNDLHNVHLHIEQTYGLSSLATIEEALHLVAHRNAFHPIKDFLNGLSWDGQERIRYALHHFLGAEESDYTFEVLKLLMVGAITRIFRPGAKFDYIVCLVGDQGVGKSSFSRMLAFNDEWFTDDLKDLENNAVYEKLQGRWIVELSEMLAANNAKSNEAIKSFLSRQTDTYRTPYERYPKDRPRQCVFIGTTNKISFLPTDRTGNRRFIPILCSEKDAEVFILDDEDASREYIQQMWAEAMTYFRKGASLKLPKELEEKARIRQREFMQEDTNADAILGFMECFQGDKVCSKQLFKEALNNPYTHPQRWQTNEINEIMNQLIKSGALPGWQRFENPRRFGSEYGTQKGWERIPSVNGASKTDVNYPSFIDAEDIDF